MAVTLIGEIVNSCDATTGFLTGAISGDDDFVEGTGALGIKASNTTVELYTTSLGVTAPYSFASGGGEFGYHMIMWFNTKTPINATSGLRMVVGNGTSRGNWYVIPNGFYKGGFITRVKDLAAPFDVIQAGSWTLGGNPAQLSNITQMGGGFTTITSIMGSFNNVQIDQITIGLGLRVDAGTLGTPNTFETVRVADEDTAFYGWWSSANGSFIGKGKLFIGPSSGSATSVFNDIAFSVIFANEEVATGFYSINMRGANTDVTWELANISAASPNDARWSISADTTTKSFTDINGVWSGSDTLTLHSGTTLSGTTTINGISLIQNSATISEITVLNAKTSSGVGYLTSNNPEKVSNSTFNYSSGHSITIISAGTYTFTGNKFLGAYSGTTGSNLTPNTGNNAAMIYNNSGGLVTLNIAGDGTTPSVRNGAGATTVVNNNTSITITGLKDLTEIRVYDNATSNPQTQLAGIEDAVDGTTNNRSFTFSLPASSVVDIVYVNKLYDSIPPRTNGFIVPSTDTSFSIVQLLDPNYNGSGT